jgi:hypothetical protein
MGLAKAKLNRICPLNGRDDGAGLPPRVKEITNNLSSLLAKKAEPFRALPFLHVMVAHQKKR